MAPVPNKQTSDIMILSSESWERVIERKWLIQSLEDWFLSKQRLKTEDKVVLFRLLATMTNAGLPILKSLWILLKQEKNPIARNIYSTMISGIKGGKNLSDAFREFGEIFGEAECSIIESGEKTGKLNHALNQLAEQTEKVSSIGKKLKSAMIYPLSIVIVMIGSIGVLMVMVVPKLIEIFGDKSRLPPLTQLLIAVSNAFVGYWWLMIMVLVALFGLFQVWKRTPTGLYRFHQFLISAPIVGILMRKVILSKFARVLSNLLASGISIVEAMRIVASVVDNEVYRQRIMLLREDIKKGIKIGESLEDDTLFPDILVQMIKVGEETAKLDSIILKLADFYDEEVDTAITTINKTLEPVIIVTMAIVVGFIAVGIMQPIMNLSDAVTGDTGAGG